MLRVFSKYCEISLTALTCTATASRESCERYFHLGLGSVGAEHPAQVAGGRVRLLRRVGGGPGQLRLLQPGADGEGGEGVAGDGDGLHPGLVPLHPAPHPRLLAPRRDHGHVELHEAPLQRKVVSEGERVLVQRVLQPCSTHVSKVSTKVCGTIFGEGSSLSAFPCLVE